MLNNVKHALFSKLAYFLKQMQIRVKQIAQQIINRPAANEKPLLFSITYWLA